MDGGDSASLQEAPITQRHDARHSAPFRRAIALTGIAALIVSCGGSNSTTAPSGSSGSPSGIVLSNPRVSTFGLQNVACHLYPGVTYTALDAVSIDFSTSRTDLIGAKVVHSDGTSTRTGQPIAACTLPPPCPPGPELWCMTPGSSSKGTLTGYVIAVWQPTTEWHFRIDSDTGPSNEVVTSIARTEGLPYGNQAAIASFMMTPCSNDPSDVFAFCRLPPNMFPNGGYGVQLLAYHPNIQGNLLTLNVNVFAGTRQVFSSVNQTTNEGTTPFHTYSITGSVTTAPPPYRAVATMRETNAQGAVVVEETRELMYP